MWCEIAQNTAQNFNDLCHIHESLISHPMNLVNTLTPAVPLRDLTQHMLMPRLAAILHDIGLKFRRRKQHLPRGDAGAAPRRDNAAIRTGIRRCSDGKSLGKHGFVGVAVAVEVKREC